MPWHYYYYDLYRQKIVLGKNKCLCQAIFNFMDFWALSGNFLFYILWNIWKLPNEIVSYDTYIILEKHLGAMTFHFKRCHSNYYDKLLHIWSLLVSFAHLQFINWWYFALVSTQAKNIPATSHNQNGASITSNRCYKERCGRHIFLRNNCFSMTSFGLQTEYSSLHAHRPQPLLLPGGWLYYT